MLHQTPRGLRIGAKEIEAVFSAQQQQSNIGEDKLCPRCGLAKLRYLKWNEEQAELELKADAIELERQRGIFGPGLKRPFGRYEVEEMGAKASTLRFALRYLPHPERLIAYFRQHPTERLIARRCAKCAKPMLCVDSSNYLANYRVYYPMIEFFKPKPDERGYFIPKCLHCGNRQKLRTLWEGQRVMLQGRDIVQWVDAFRD